MDLSIGAPPTPDVDPTMPEEDPFAGWGEEAPPAAPGTTGLAAQVSEDQVRGLLEMLGSGLNQLAGDDDVPDHWRFTDGELDQITPPLTRAVNRSERLVAAVERSDTAVIAATLVGFGWRNYSDGVRAARRRTQETEEVAPHHGRPSEGRAQPVVDHPHDAEVDRGAAPAGAPPAIPGAFHPFPG